MVVYHGPTGNVVRGHVLDVSFAGFSRALSDMDPLLYCTWNPKKLKGWGAWEIRRRPTRKFAVYKGTHEGVSFYSLEHVELGQVHHILDCAFLNYDAINKLKSMDTFNKDHWINNLEYLEKKQAEETLAKAKQERLYAFRQHKTAMAELKNMVASGVNPHRIINSTNWDQK